MLWLIWVLATAVGARTVATMMGVSKDEVEEYFICGLLHDIGKIVLMAVCPSEFADAVRDATDTHSNLAFSEMQHTGLDHAEAGLLLAEKWKLNENVCEAIEDHHHPRSVLKHPEYVKAVCIANNMVLFDFADIESYDPDWNYYLDLGCNDNCDYSGGNWAANWCGNNPSSDLCASCSCAHSQSLNCNLKARAFWWMMARLAGWPGVAPGDTNCDGSIDFTDINPMVTAMLSGRAAYEAERPMCSWYNNDINCDGTVDFADVNPFVGLLVD